MLCVSNPILVSCVGTLQNNRVSDVWTGCGDLGAERCRVSVMTETRQGGVGRRRSDQRWMGTIQEGVTCRRLMTDNRRQETGSRPRPDGTTFGFHLREWPEVLSCHR